MKNRSFIRNIAFIMLIFVLVTILGGCALPDVFGQNGNDRNDGMSVMLEGTVVCYAEPDFASRIVATFHEGLEVFYDEIVTIQGLQWAKCEYGWVVLAGDESSEEIEPREGFVNIEMLNVHVAPGESSNQVEPLPAGSRVVVYEISERVDGRWAKIDQGWVSLRHVYFPGEEGENTGYAVVRDDGAKVRSRILESGETVEKLKSGKRVKFLEKLEQADGTVWIYAKGGWIKGKDVYIEGDVGKRPCSGIVVDDTPLNIRKGPGTDFDIITSLPYGTYVEVVERINRGKYDWGFVGNGWIYMKNVDIKPVNNRTVRGTFNEILEDVGAGGWHYGQWKFKEDGTFTYNSAQAYYAIDFSKGTATKKQENSGAKEYTYSGKYTFDGETLKLTYKKTNNKQIDSLPFTEVWSVFSYDMNLTFNLVSNETIDGRNSRKLYHISKKVKEVILGLNDMSE